MAIAKKLNHNQRLISLTYDSMDTLLERKSKMTNTLNNYLTRSGNIHTITDNYISLDEIGTYKLNYVLTLNSN